MKEKVVNLGEDFIISVESNPTTGFSWQTSFNEAILKLKDKKFEPTTNAIGSGGREKFTFTPLKCGESILILEYKRPWETKVAEKREIYIKIQK